MIATQLVGAPALPVPHPDPLRPEHRHQLEVASAIPADILAEEGVVTIGDTVELPRPAEALRHPNADKGKRFGRRPPVDGGGILFPIRNPDGELTYQFKPDRPREREGKPVKYETPPGTRLALHVPARVRPVLQRADVSLWFTEGAKKVLAGVGAGLPIIGLMGVDGWVVNPGDGPSEPLPDWDAITLAGRVCFLAYDSDAVTKPAVRAAEGRLRDFLEGRGATVLLVRIPDAADGGKQGLDDYIATGGSVGALVADAIRRGVETCRGCEDRTAIIEEQAEELRAHKAAEHLVRHGPFTPDAAQVHKQLVTVARAARASGKERVPLLREDVARLALGDQRNVKAVTRAFAAYRPYQDDPELAATLPYRLDWRDEGGKTHVDLIPAPGETEQARAQAFLALCRLPKPDDRRRGPNVDGRRHRPGACPRCQSPQGMERRAVYRCLNDACGHVYHGKPMVVGAEPSESADPGQNVPHSTYPHAGQNVPDLAAVAMHGAAFATEVRAGADPGQNVPDPTGVPLIPISFVTPEDREVAHARPWHRPTVLHGPPPDQDGPSEPSPCDGADHASSPGQLFCTGCAPATREVPGWASA